MAKHNQNQLSSDDSKAERQEKLAAAQREKEEADAAALEDKRKAEEKAAADAAKEAARKPTAAHPQVSAGTEPHNPDGSDKPVAGRLVEVVKAGQSGGAAGGGVTRYTRQQLVDIVAKGGSVLHNGTLYHNIAGLPPESQHMSVQFRNVSGLPGEAAFAKGDPEAEARVKQTLDLQIAALQQQRDSLGKK